MKAVILAAGPSDRLQPFTESRAKPMIRVAGRTILENMTGALQAAGVTDIILVVNHKRETIESYFEHGSRFGLNIEYLLQEPLDGIGAGLKRCEPLLEDEAFLLIYGDVLTTGPMVEGLLQRHMESSESVAALSLPASSSDFGNVYLDQEMRIVGLVEKPSDPKLSNYVFAGAFVLQRPFLGLLAEHGNDIEKCYQHLIAAGTLTGAIWEGGWIDIGCPWDILEANRILMSRWETAEIHHTVKFERNVQIEGAVHIEQEVVLAAGTVLKGPCFIGRGSYIGNNALIREYSSLGPKSVVGYGTELKNCVLFGQSILGRLSFIGDSVIGEGVHLGTGVATVNVAPNGGPILVETPNGPVSTGFKKLGAFIGDDARIGARNVLAPGTHIRAGQVVDDLITVRTIL